MSTRFAARTVSGIGLRFMMGEARTRIELGRARLPAADVRRLRPGSVIELDADPDADVSVLAGECVVATGRCIVAGGRIAVEIGDVSADAAMKDG
mgnify:CR=1 FL=1